VNYDTAWLLHNKIMKAMSEREDWQCPFAWCKTFGPNALIRG
jgi:hypothetical protein